MRVVVAIVFLAAASVARAGNTNGFEKYVSNLAAAPAEAAKRLGECQMLVTPGGAVREPCKLELADLVGTAQGVTLTANRMREALARRGVVPIDAVGQPFDPTLHEALLEVPSAEGIAPGAVAQEVQRGYRRGDRALRAARVVVARA